MLKKQCDIFNMKRGMYKDSMGQAILARARKHSRGWVFTPQDFADLGDTRSVGVALTRLVRDGQIRRIARGLYDLPRPHPVLKESVASADAVVKAIARKKKMRVLPSKAVAANQLGLSEQVPSKMIYHTDGAPSSVQLGRFRIVFRRNTGRLMSLSGRVSGVVAQALRYLGKDNLTPGHIKILRSRLTAEDLKQLRKDVSHVPAWMRPHFKRITDKDA